MNVGWFSMVRAMQIHSTHSQASIIGEEAKDNAIGTQRCSSVRLDRSGYLPRHEQHAAKQPRSHKSLLRSERAAKTVAEDSKKGLRMR